jgi:GAG-pre-integrase domain
MGRPPTRCRDGAVKSGWGHVCQCRKSEPRLPDGVQGDPSKAGMAARTTGEREPTHEELARRLETVVMVATARGAEGTKATLLTWHRRLGHLSFKTVVALSESGANGMVITDLPTNIPGLDACAACVAAKTTHSPHPHKEGWKRAGEDLGRVHIDIAGPMLVKSAGGKECEYIVVDTTVVRCTRAHYGTSRRHQRPSMYSRPRWKTSRRRNARSHDRQRAGTLDGRGAGHLRTRRH